MRSGKTTIFLCSVHAWVLKCRSGRIPVSVLSPPTDFMTGIAMNIMAPLFHSATGGASESACDNKSFQIICDCFCSHRGTEPQRRIPVRFPFSVTLCLRERINRHDSTVLFCSHRGAEPTERVKAGQLHAIMITDTDTTASQIQNKV